MAVQRPVAEKWQEVTGNVLTQGYGLTETSPLVTTNDVVAPLYLGAVEQAFTDREQGSMILSDGEQHKTLDCFSKIIDTLIDRGFIAMHVS